MIHRLRKTLVLDLLDERKYAGATRGFGSTVVDATGWSEVHPRRVWTPMLPPVGPVLRGSFAETDDGAVGALAVAKEIHHLDSFLRCSNALARTRSCTRARM